MYAGTAFHAYRFYKKEKQLIPNVACPFTGSTRCQKYSCQAHISAAIQISDNFSCVMIDFMQMLCYVRVVTAAERRKNAETCSLPCIN